MNFTTNLKSSIVLCVLFISFLKVSAQTESKKPKLIVGITVDQMRYDYLTRFSEKYTDDGFKRLLSEGFSFENNYLNYIPTNTGPGHASIHTGTTPSVHGIINNFWYDRDTDSPNYCVYDPSYQPIGTGSKFEISSPNKLLANTISDANRIQSNLKGKTISIALKDRAAVLSGGKKANAAYWFRGQSLGHWISSSYYIKELPSWVKVFNESTVVNTYMKIWEPLYDIETYTESNADENNYERGFRGKETATFPYDLKALAAENQNFELLKSTPFGNSLTFDFASAALKGERLGKRAATDFLLISLSSTDYIGHNFGVSSKEVEDTYLRLDKDLADFLNTLDKHLGKGNYTLFLTSDHGASENAHNLTNQDVNAAYFKEATFKINVKDYAFSTYGTAKIINNISNDQIYLNRELIALSNLVFSEVETNIKQFIAAQPYIKSVISRTDIINNNCSGELAILLVNGMHPTRSGDILYALEPHILVYSEKGSDHGSGYDYDTHTPLLFYGFGINQGNTTNKSYSIDIVPTIAELLQISPPETATGKVLKEVIPFRME
jgi:predicted AlkP superfamily pyrophosphatase or phosphodiesterase